MAAVRDVRQKRLAFLGFLVCENCEKHPQAISEYVDHSTASSWAQRTSGKYGHANIHYLPRSCRPHSEWNNVGDERLRNITMANRRTTVKQPSLYLDNGERSVCIIFKKKLGFANFCARWVREPRRRSQKLRWTVSPHRQIITSSLNLKRIMVGQNLRPAIPLRHLCKSGSKALILSFTVRAYMSLFRGGVRQLKETGTMLENSTLFLNSVRVH
jgi:hypothetical protein